jgi:hypothetical protein
MLFVWLAFCLAVGGRATPVYAQKQLPATLRRALQSSSDCLDFSAINRNCPVAQFGELVPRTCDGKYIGILDLAKAMAVWLSYVLARIDPSSTADDSCASLYTSWFSTCYTQTSGTSSLAPVFATHGSELQNFNVLCQTVLTHDSSVFTSVVSITNTRNGVACSDAAVGSGYMLYSEESVHTRFQNMLSSNADNYACVTLSNSRWYYDNNNGPMEFAPRHSDVLVAFLDFASDDVTMATSVNYNIGSALAGYIHLGYIGGDLAFVPNRWGGTTNAGEWGISGHQWTRLSVGVGSTGMVALDGINNGVACADDAGGRGYMLYTEANAHTRFPGIHPQNADHFVCVNLTTTGQWVYDTNSRQTLFTPVASDILVATLDHTHDTVQMAMGLNQEVGTTTQIHLGYNSGDISVIPNMWGGALNRGEWGITGSTIVTGSGVTKSGVANPVGQGDVACGDGRAGTGYMMYSVANVHTRFSNINGAASDHFICVVYSSGHWEYDPNSNTGVPFSPVQSDVLVATLDFTADTVVMAAGLSRDIGTAPQMIHLGCASSCARLRLHPLKTCLLQV